MTFKNLAIETMSQICKIRLISEQDDNKHESNVKNYDNCRKFDQMQLLETHCSPHLVETSIARNHEIAIVLINPCKQNSTQSEPTDGIRVSLSVI